VRTISDETTLTSTLIMRWRKKEMSSLSHKTKVYHLSLIILTQMFDSSDNVFLIII